MLTKESAAKILEAGKTTGADYVEIFVENTYRAALSMLSSQIENCQSGIDAGVGVRLLFGDQVYYSYSNTLDEKEIISLIYKQKSQLRDIAGKEALPPFCPTAAASQFSRSGTLNSRPRCAGDPEGGIIADHRSGGPQGGSADWQRQTFASLCHVVAEPAEEVQVFTSEGGFTEDERNYIRILCQAIAGDGMRESKGYEAPGAQAGWEYTQSLDIEQLGGPGCAACPA